METFLYTRVQHSLSHYDHQTAIFICEQLLSLCQSQTPKQTVEDLARQIIHPTLNQPDHSSTSHAFTHSVILLLAQCYFESGDGTARAHHLLRTTLQNYAPSIKQSVNQSNQSNNQPVSRTNDAISHRYLLARCCISLGLTEEAETVLNGAVELINQSANQVNNPGDHSNSQASHASLIYYWLGVISQSTSRIKDAKRFFEQAIKIDSWNWSAYQALIALGPDVQSNTQSLSDSIFDPISRHAMDYASKMFQVPSLDAQTTAQLINQPMFTINVPINPPKNQIHNSSMNQTNNQTPMMMTPNNSSQYSTPLQNQLINQSFNQSFNQSTNQSHNQAASEISFHLNQSSNQSTLITSNYLSIKQPMFMTPASRSLSSIISRPPINQSINLSMVTPTVNESSNPPANQPISRTRPAQAPAVKQSPSSKTPKRPSNNRTNSQSLGSPTHGSSISQSINQSTAPFKQPASRINTSQSTNRQTFSSTGRGASPRKSPRMSDVTPKQYNQTSNQPAHARNLSRSRSIDDSEATMEIDAADQPIHSPTAFDLSDEKQTTGSTSPLNLSISETITLFQTLAQAAELLADYECKKCISLLNEYLSTSQSIYQTKLSNVKSQTLNQTLLLNRSFLSLNPYVCLLYARCSFELCDWSSCISYFVLYQRINPFSLTGLDYYSSALWQTHRANELSALSINLSVYPAVATHPISLIVGANCHSLHKDHAQSLSFLSRAQAVYQVCHQSIYQSPASVAYAYTLAGHESLSLDDVNGASSCYRRALALDHRSFGAWFGLSHVFSRADQHSPALYHLKQAASINRHSIPILLQLGKTGLTIEDYELSAACLDAARAEGCAGAVCAQIEYHASQHAIALGEWDVAWEALLRVSAVAPREASVYASMARVAGKCGDLQQAIRCANHAIDLDPKDANQAKSVLEQLMREGKDEEEEQAY